MQEETRRYPRGIQILVSTYLLGAQFAGGVVFWASQNSKVIKYQDLPKFQFGGGGYSPQVKSEKS